MTWLSGIVGVMMSVCIRSVILYCNMPPQLLPDDAMSICRIVYYPPTKRRRGNSAGEMVDREQSTIHSVIHLPSV